MSRLLAVITGLAVKDCRQEWPSALCMVLSMTAVLVPILLLLSIRSGIVGQIQNELSSNPRARELITIGEPKISSKLLAKYRRDGRVGFVAPRTRLLSAAAVMRSADRLRSTEVDMVPSGPGDPHLAAPLSDTTIVITEKAARQLVVRKGASVELIVDRRKANGKHQQIRRTLLVAEIVGFEKTGSNLNRAYLPAAFVEATERWREDPAIASIEDATIKNGQEAAGRSYSGLRIFAKDIDHVERLRDELLLDGIETNSQVDDIRLVKRLNQSMIIFVGSLASLMIIGLIVALAAIQWSWVERKRYDYSYLRLLGMSRAELAFLPVIQAGVLTFPAAALSLALTYLAQAIVNRLFAGQLAGISQVSDVSIFETLFAIAATFPIAAAGAFFAARNAARANPIDALRG